MKFPLRSTVQIGRYVASQKGNDRYPLVIMLEPTLGCNIACIGCGKIREYESNKARLTVDRKSTRLNSSHGYISYAVFCLKKKITRFRRAARHQPHHRGGHLGLRHAR